MERIMDTDNKNYINKININLRQSTILVTGATSFSGSNFVLELLRIQSPVTVIGSDNMNDYYNVPINTQFQNGFLSKEALRTSH